MGAATDEGAWPSGGQQQLCGGNLAHGAPYKCNSVLADIILELFEQLLGKFFISESTGLTVSSIARLQPSQRKARHKRMHSAALPWLQPLMQRTSAQLYLLPAAVRYFCGR